MVTKARQLAEFIANADVDSDEIATGAVSASKLAATLDLSSKALTFAANQISGNSVDGGVISNFASTGIDDNASSTAVTILSSGNVGVGTASPGARLTLSGTAGAADNSSVMLIALGTTLKTYFGTANATGNIITGSSSGDTALRSNGHNILFSVDSGSSSAVYIKSDGKVGIGTTSPSTKLHVDGNGSAAELRVAQNSTYYTDIGINHIDVAGNDLRILMAGAEKWRFKNAGNLEATGTQELRTGIKGTHGYEAYYGANGLRFNRDGDSYIDTKGSNNNLKFRHNSNYDTAMTILGSNGKVGIGTTSPGQKLTVAGGIESTSGQGSVAFYSTTAGSYNQQNGTGGTAWAYGSTGGSSAPNTAASTMFGFHHWNGSAWSNPLNLKADGKVGIGTSNPVGTLHLHSADTAVRLTSSQGSNTPLAQLQYSGSGGYFLRMGDSSNNEDVMIRTYGNSHFNGGNVGIGTTSPDSLLHLQKTRGTISDGSSDTGAVIKLHTEAQWESGYGNNSSDATNDYLGSIEFSTGDSSTGEGVRAAIRGTVDSYYNQNSIVFETCDQGDTTLDERMRIHHNGNVGIGFANPQQLLHVQAGSTGNGTVRVGGGAGLEISHNNSGTTVQRIDSLYRTTSAAAELQLRTGILTAHIGSSTTESMRLDGANGLQIMTDSSNGTNADNVSIRYNGTAGGHKSGYLFRDKRNAVNAAIKNNLQDDSTTNFAAHMEFQTAHGGTLTTQMTIDRYGQVMMPNQPSFRAYSTNDYTANGVLESANWTEQYDNNGDFSNGRFTAPVDGVYLFEVMWDSLNSQGGLNLLKNANYYLAKWEPTGLSNDAWESKHYSTTVKLSSGDYVRLVGAHASGTNPFHMGSGHWGFFAGHLLG